MSKTIEELEEDLRKQAKEIKTKEELFAYIEKIEKEYCFDYDGMTRAIAYASTATFEYLMNSQGATGFQYNCSRNMWVRYNYFHKNNCGFYIRNYDDMLNYYEDSKFEKYIPKGCFEMLQKLAKERLEKKPEVEKEIQHLKSIIDGTPPFGYKIINNIN